MSGVISKDFSSTNEMYDANGIEITGVYSGVLQEDMIDTVRRVHKPFIDVLVTDHFKGSLNYPLTYVPLGFNTLPLRKGQEVLVKFEQGDPRYPVLYKIPQAYTEEGMFLKDPELPEATDNIEFPDVSPTKDVAFFNENFQVIGTEKYLMLRQKDYIILFEPDKLTTNYPNVQVLCSHLILETDKMDEFFHDEVTRTYDKKVTEKFSDEVNQEFTKKLIQSIKDALEITATKGVTIDGSSGKVIIKNTAGGDLGAILSDAFNSLATTSPTTQGSPGAQQFNPSIITAMTTAKTKIDALLKG